MTTNLPTETAQDSALLEQVVIGGDLSKLTPAQRVKYYRDVCASLGLNPLTKPFAYLTLDNKLVLYAQRDCTDQLRTIRRISVKLGDSQVVDEVYIARAIATDHNGRTDESTGAVALSPWDKSAGKYAPLKGEKLANAIMKAETKAKRRVTLSICGLGIMDEAELDTVPQARRVADPDVTQSKSSKGIYDPETGEVIDNTPPAEIDWTEWAQNAKLDVERSTSVDMLDNWCDFHADTLAALTLAKRAWGEKLTRIIEDKRDALRSAAT